jgi:WD40 repeat protein/tRNA A-37 threonylcarbamoyl transferase component Bud32
VSTEPTPSGKKTNPGLPEQTLDTIVPQESAFASVTYQGAQAGEATVRVLPEQQSFPVVPGYQILGELGRGAMGVVYKARQIKANRIVALKMILSGAHAGKDEVARFQTEAESSARLHHPNIVQVYDVGEHEGRPFFSLEFCDGGSLERKVAGAPLSAIEAARMVETLARAMYAAHQQHVIHRDLKPANVLLQEGAPKISDFGLAKKLDEAGQTASGSVMGTPSYMAPEQASGKVKELSPACDIYALGGILYHCLTGQPPFRAATVMDTLMQVIHNEPLPPTRLASRTPRDLETVCLKCLEKDPQRRYATAHELAEDLHRFLNHEPVSARPVSRPERFWRWCRRNPAIVAGTIAALAIIVLGIGTWFADQLRREKNETEEARKEAEVYRAKAERLSALMIFRKGADLCEEGDAGRGILWMAHSLSVCPESAHDLDRTIRTGLSSAAVKLHTLESVHASPTPIVAAAFSPDGKTVLVGGKDAYLLETGTWKRRGDAQAAVREISGGAFSPDGKLFVTSTMGGIVRVGDGTTGKDVGPAIHHPGTAKSVVFSPDGKTILVGAQFGVTLQGYDVKTRQPISPEFTSPEGLSITGTSAVGLLASAGPLVAASTLVPGRSCLDNVYAAVYSPDGKRIATAAMERTARIWDAKTGQTIGRPLIHPGVVFTAAFTPDGKTLATGCLDGGIRFWDVETGKPADRVLRHRGAVRSITFNRDGSLMATSSEDGVARVWETASGRPVGQVLSHPSEMRHALFNPDETHLLTAGFEGTIRLWRLAQEQSLAKVLPHPGAVAVALFSPEGRSVLTGCQESEKRPGESRLWNAVTGEPLGPPMSQNGQVMGAAFSPDGKLALTVGNDRTARLWNTSDSTPAQPPWQYGNVVAAAAFSPDGKIAAIGGRGSVVQLREVSTGKEVGHWQAYDRQGLWVWTLEFTPDGKTLLSGGGLAGRLWNMPDGTSTGQAMEHVSEARTALLSPDGQVVLTCSHDKTARLWSARDGQALCPPLVHKGEVRTGAFHPSGKVVATCAADGTVRLWEVPSGKSLMPPLLHDNWVRSVAFSPDGVRLATGCDDGTARLWNADDGASLGAVLQHRGPVNRVVFSPNGKTVLTASGDGTARLWTPPPPIEGKPASVALWLEVQTGMELDADQTVHLLPADAWQQRRQELEGKRAEK